MRHGRKVSISLLVACAVVGSTFASEANNKTHLNPARICREGVAAYTTFHKMKSDKIEKGFRGSIEATGFYGRSVNGSHLGRSFGADGTRTIQVVGDSSNSQNLGTLRTKKQVLNDLLLHNYYVSAYSASTLAGTLCFDPKQTMYGVRLDYLQRFDKWLDGLFAALVIPFIHVKNSLNLKILNSVPGVDSDEGVKLIDLLVGKAVVRSSVDEVAVNAQAALKYAKMCPDSKTGLGDITAQVGWRFMEGRKYHAGINAELIFPTGDKANARYLWGARTGEAKWGVGVGVDGSGLLWEEKDQNLQILAAIQYRYLFDGTEKRTIGLSELKYHDGSKINLVKDPLLSQYYLVGTASKAGLRPLANISTFDVTVKPGSQLDGTIALAYNNAGFTLDLGYNMFWKEAERVRCKSGGTCTRSCETSADPCDTECGTKETCIPGDWKNDTYGIADWQYSSAAIFAADGTDTLADSTDGFISAYQFNYRAAETPSQLIHTVFTGIGYIKKFWGYPIMTGAGVAYHIPSSNRDSLEGYSFWAKAGFTF
ncbi:hypothetical protein KKA53_03885 [Candidatus Dependentiae bacterium]|nr:hypothetical protein [Candidatus Dependentiae bacterium]